ncbi:MAG: hypothetical protein V4547_17145 [Bacteroidota bacterium]
MIIAIDFDGTCVTHEYPKVGQDIGAIPVIKLLVENGHQLMLWTMRGNKPQDEVNTLQDAVDWFKDNDIPLWGINENPTQKETGWSNSNKQYAQMYIDDAALGCPLVHFKHERPYADWDKIKFWLTDMQIIKP